jgi:hypothetical protein
MVEMNLIRNQYSIRKNKELNSEQQLRIFLKDSMRDYLSDYNARRRMIAQELIKIGAKLKEARIAEDTKLDLNTMQELRYRYSAKDARGLQSALNDVKTYQECCAIAESARSRGLTELADEASQKADIVGYKGYLSNEDYRAAIKAVNKGVTYAVNPNFMIKDIDHVLEGTPTLIPIGDVILMATGEFPDATDKQIARVVEKDLGTSEDILTGAELATLNSLDK